MSLLTGAGLAVSAGLNAYVPLLVLGLAGRLVPGVDLPGGWGWLENEWTLGILAVLLVIEVVADKIPWVDSVNDIVQTVVRPASGGIAFGSGAGATTAVVADPAAFFTSDAWIPVAAGVVLALAAHALKALARPIANAATGGLAAPIVSAVEDVGSLALSIAAIFVPVLVVVGVAGLLVWFLLGRRRAKRKRAELERSAARAASSGSGEAAR